MDRIGTNGLQRTLVTAMQRNQAKLAATQVQLATGKRAATYRDLGADAMPSLGARSMIAREKAYEGVGIKVDQVLGAYEHALSHLYDSTKSLHDAVANAVAMSESRGIGNELQAAFEDLKQVLNTNQGGEYLFAGSRNDQPPFAPATIADLDGLATVGEAFTNDNLRARARVGDGVDMSYGLLASEVGTSVATALRTLSATGPVEGPLTSAQQDALNDVMQDLKTALGSLTSVQSSNGRRQAQSESYQERASLRITQLETIVGKQEDVDPTEVASQLVNEQLALNASYEAFSQIRDMSLINFLR